MPYRNYLYNILTDGARPFLYRNKIYSLLGIPDNQNITFSFPPNLPPVGFRYVNHPLTSELNLSYPYENHTSNITVSNSHHNYHSHTQVSDHDEDKDMTNDESKQRQTESDESGQEENSRNLNSPERKYIHNSVSKPKTQESFTFKPEKNSTEINMPEIKEIDQSKASQRKPFAYKKDGDINLSDMIEPSEVVQMPSVKSKGKTLQSQGQNMQGISSEFDIDIPGVSDRKLVFPLLSSSDEKKENLKRADKSDRQADRDEMSDSHYDKSSKSVKTYQKPFKRKMSETSKRDNRETSGKKVFFPQDRLQGTKSVDRESTQFPHIQQDTELQRKNRVYKKVTKMIDHHVEEQRVVRKTSKSKQIEQDNEIQEFIIIKKESPPLASSYAFWERSYLSRFLLKLMR